MERAPHEESLIEIRALTEGDAGKWWQLRLESLQGDPLAFGRTVDEHVATPVSVIEARLRDTATGNFTLGAWQGESLVGMATFVRETAPMTRHRGHVYGVYLAPMARGRGAGRALIQTLLNRAFEDRSLEQIVLGVSDTQEAAKNLYRSLGFRTWGIEPAARKLGNRELAEEHMILARLRPL